MFDAYFLDLNNIHSIENNNIKDSSYGDILPAIGEYHVLKLGPKYPIAISTLQDDGLAENLYKQQPPGLSLVGKTETENIGIEKIIQNILAAPTIKYLLLCGNDPAGHQSGNSILALYKNGLDDKKRIIDAKGKKPILVNTTIAEITAFIKQVEVIDLIGCVDENIILAKVEELRKLSTTNISFNIEENPLLIRHNKNRATTFNSPKKDPYQVKIDKNGYFVIVPKADIKQILVEHYSNKNHLLRIIKGNNTRDIYWTIIDNKWISELSHAAYLGKELTRAELSIKDGSKYVQDKA